MWARYQKIWGEDAPPELLTLAAVNMVGNHERYNWAYNAAFRYDVLPDIPRVHCPTLFLTAEFDLPAEEDGRSVGQIAGARQVIVSGERGQLPWRVPERFAQEVGDFVLQENQG